MNDLISRIGDFVVAVSNAWIAWVAAVPFFVEQALPYLPSKISAWLDGRWPLTARTKHLRAIAVAGIGVACFQAFDQANSQLRVERDKAQISSPKWQLLTPLEQSRLRERLRNLKPMEIGIMCAYPICFDLAETFRSTFNDVKWNGGLHSTFFDSGDEVGITLFSNSEQASAVVRAIEEATAGRLKVEWKKYYPPSKYTNLIIGRLKH